MKLALFLGNVNLQMKQGRGPRWTAQLPCREVPVIPVGTTLCKGTDTAKELPAPFLNSWRPYGQRHLKKYLTCRDQERSLQGPHDPRLEINVMHCINSFQWKNQNPPKRGCRTLSWGFLSTRVGSFDPAMAVHQWRAYSRHLTRARHSSTYPTAGQHMFTLLLSALGPDPVLR